MSHKLIPLTILFASVAVAAPVVAAQSVQTPAASATIPSAPAVPTASTGEAEAQPAASMAMACGMTQAKVANIIDHYDLDPDMGVVASALQQPFNCGAYGQLCNVLGAVDAQQYACNAWQGLNQELAPIEIEQGAHDFLDAHLEDCTPDPEVCVEICEKAGAGNDVLSCTGWQWGGKCRSLAICDLFHFVWNIPFLDLLGPV